MASEQLLLNPNRLVWRFDLAGAQGRALTCCLSPRSHYLNMKTSCSSVLTIDDSLIDRRREDLQVMDWPPV
jgi:hypothetical protein